MIENNFEDKVRISFLKVKEDMIKLEKEIELLKSIIIEQKAQNDLFLLKIEDLIKIKPKEEQITQEKKYVSIGNEGVYADMHAHKHAHMHIIPIEKPQNNLISDKLSDIDKTFLGLTKKEFLIFLTIYQLDEDIGKVTYDDLSSHFKLTPGCIRSHISNMIKKNMPIIRTKINNKLTIFSISDDFKRLNLKSRLFNLYNNQDPYQKKLI